MPKLARETALIDFGRTVPGSGAVSHSMMLPPPHHTLPSPGGWAGSYGSSSPPLATPIAAPNSGWKEGETSQNNSQNVDKKP